MTERNLQDRSVVFRFEDGHLVREVTASEADGRSYRHRCDRATLEAVAGAVGEAAAVGTTLAMIARDERLAFTRANVALEFLKERGLVDVRNRRCFPAVADVHLDALIEFHALGEELAGPT